VIWVTFYVSEQHEEDIANVSDLFLGYRPTFTGHAVPALGSDQVGRSWKANGIIVDSEGKRTLKFIQTTGNLLLLDSDV
jgi:hypothetical protein